VSAVEGPAVERDDPTRAGVYVTGPERAGAEENLVYFQEVEDLWLASLTLDPNGVRSSLRDA
jgi:hypothetical protein